jgi:multidrug efflux pump subunit AcrB
MPRDILPDLSIPVIYVAQPYGGLDPAQMESYLTYYYEYHFLYISGIEHIESKSIQSASLIKLQFFPGTDMAQAMSEVVAEVNRSRAFMPAGTLPPFVMRFDAGSTPIGKLVFTSDKRSLPELQNYALNYVRPIFATLPGVSAPPPFGASARTIVIEVDPKKLISLDLSADQITNAIISSNSIIPSGNIHDGDLFPIVSVNGVVNNFKTLLNTPVRPGKNNPVFLKDFAVVKDSSDLTTGYAIVNGQRTVYIPVTKRADASTLTVVDLVKENLPRFRAVVPEDVKVDYEFDQSGQVRHSISSLVTEALIGAILTGLMVLVFLRDARSVFIVVANIPLALLSAVLALWLTNQTINIMTLGGLALAVGILVDETTVTIENIHAHMAKGATVARAALDGTNEILKPAFLTLLCILSVFIPSFFMEGVSRALFIPLTLSVGFSMISSFILSRTLVPVLSAWLLKGHFHVDEKEEGAFVKFQKKYQKLLKRALSRKKIILPLYFMITVIGAIVCLMNIGGEIFPQADSHQFQLRIRGKTGLAIEETEKLNKKIMDLTKEIVGDKNFVSSVSFVGTQPSNYAINNIYLWTSGPQEAVAEVELNENMPMKLSVFKEKLRALVKERMPGVDISFEPANMVDRAMSEGATTPIEISVTGNNLQTDYDFAKKIKESLSSLPYLRDMQFGQRLDFPVIKVHVDRLKAGFRGISVAEVGTSIIPATSSSRFIAQNYWSDPKSGINYQVQVQVPQNLMTSLESVANIPLEGYSGDPVPVKDISTITHETMVGEYDRYNMQRMITIDANLHGIDLAHATRDILKKIDALKAPRGTEVHTRGQMFSLIQMFKGLSGGLLLAIVIIFLLLAANFESLKLSLSVMSTIPAVLCGSLSFLLITGSTLNIESFMGMIMSIGVSVANSILVVTFSERHRLETGNSELGALEGATSRLRPILMTSFAMLAGMMPMSLGLGEGGNQTAPLGRAVIGGLFASTIATLTILPQVFAFMQRSAKLHSNSLDPDDSEAKQI